LVAHSAGELAQKKPHVGAGLSQPSQAGLPV
jgi:hypothetical protein